MFHLFFIFFILFTSLSLHHQKPEKHTIKTISYYH